MDIFAFPSLFEGHPNSILEAMAAGLPVIASDIPGNNELVRHGETGYLFPKCNANTLAEQITNLSSDANEMNRLGRNGKMLVETEFTILKMVQEFENIYENSLPY